MSLMNAEKLVIWSIFQSTNLHLGLKMQRKTSSTLAQKSIKWAPREKLAGICKKELLDMSPSLTGKLCNLTSKNRLRKRKQQGIGQFELADPSWRADLRIW
jgi:hypothetical protein